MLCRSEVRRDWEAPRKRNSGASHITVSCSECSNLLGGGVCVQLAGVFCTWGQGGLEGPHLPAQESLQN